MVKPGDKVWVWNHGLREIVVQNVTELQGRVAVEEPGYIYIDFFESRQEAFNHRFMTICDMIVSVETEYNRNGRIQRLSDVSALAKSTRRDLRQEV